MRAVSMHVHHAIVGVPCVNVAIGVVLGELHVVRVVPVFVCDVVVDLTPQLPRNGSVHLLLSPPSTVSFPVVLLVLASSPCPCFFFAFAFSFTIAFLFFLLHACHDPYQRSADTVASESPTVVLTAAIPIGNF